MPHVPSRAGRLTGSAKARVAMLSPTREANARSSQEICRAAATVYESLFARLTETDPDAGFGAAFASGRRAIDARAHAADWIVSDSAAQAVDRLLRAATSASEEEVADWIWMFPRRLLQAMDRRTARDGEPATGRRTGDHRAVSGSVRPAI